MLNCKKINDNYWLITFGREELFYGKKEECEVYMMAFRKGFDFATESYKKRRF